MNKENGTKWGILLFFLAIIVFCASSTTLFVENMATIDIPILQTNAHLRGGNSGGGLYDKSGHLIGINTWILSEDGTSGGFGLALSADHINDVLRD